MTERGAASAVLRLAARAWARWKAIAHVIGNFQARVLLSVFYFVVAPPFALIVKVWKDPLRLQLHRGTSGWIERPAAETSPEAGRRQF